MPPMRLRMPVRSLRAATRELMPVLDEMTEAVIATPPDRRRAAKHLDRPGVIFCYAYYTALARQELPADAIVCDWGGQYGHVSKLLRPYFGKVICYVPDRTEFEVEYFHSLFGVSDIVQFGPGYGVATLPLPDESVDAVISSGVLEHTREFGVPEAESLREIWRVLRPGGKVLIWNLPRRWGSVELLNTLLRRSIHPYKYRRRDIVSLLHDAGFDITLLDQHELLNLSSRNLLGTLFGHRNAWVLDYYLSKAILLGAVAQHFTVVAQKRAGGSPAASPSQERPARRRPDHRAFGKDLRNGVRWRSIWPRRTTSKAMRSATEYPAFR